MLNVVGKKVLATSTSGAKYREFSGAGLSLIDEASDIVMIIQYTKEGKHGFATGIIATIVINTQKKENSLSPPFRSSTYSVWNLDFSEEEKI